METLGVNMGPRLRSYDRRVLLGEQVTKTDVAWFWSQVAHAASITTLLCGIEHGAVADDIAWLWAMVAQAALTQMLEGGVR